MGKGCSSKGKNLTNYRHATIRKSKLADYSLHPIKSNGKYLPFKKIGYTMKNISLLKADIKKAIKIATISGFKKSKTGEDIFTVPIVLTGPNKKSDKFLSVWKTEKSNKTPDLVNIYKKEKRRR